MRLRPRMAHKLEELPIYDKAEAFWGSVNATLDTPRLRRDRKLHEQQGIGLGLSIAKRLTELHGGTLTIESHREAATQVTIKLPQVG